MENSGLDAIGKQTVWGSLIRLWGGPLTVSVKRRFYSRALHPESAFPAALRVEGPEKGMCDCKEAPVVAVHPFAEAGVHCHRRSPSGV